MGWDEAFMFFLGGLLAAGAGVLGEWYRETMRARTLKTYLSKALRDDLTASEVLYDQLVKEWLEEKIVKYTTTNAITTSRGWYDRNRDAIIVLPDQLRMDLFTYYLYSGQLIAQLEEGQRQRERVLFKEADVFIRLERSANPDTGQPYTTSEARARVARELASDIAIKEWQVEIIQKNIAKLGAVKADAAKLKARLLSER